MYKITFYRITDNIILKEYTLPKEAARECYFQHCNMNSVRSGYNGVKMEEIK